MDLEKLMWKSDNKYTTCISASGYGPQHLKREDKLPYKYEVNRVNC